MLQKTYSNPIIGKLIIFNQVKPVIIKLTLGKQTMDMKHLITIIRYTLQIALVILFIYQSIVAVNKYIESPMVAVRSDVATWDLTRPR